MTHTQKQSQHTTNSMYVVTVLNKYVLQVKK